MATKHRISTIWKAVVFSFSMTLFVAPAFLSAEDEKPIAIAAVKHEGPVDFEKEVLPILRRNCLACHNSTEAEGELVLETPQAILKGGSEGPAAEAGKGAESYLLKLASRQEESFMPPDDNDVGAKKLTPQELGLIKLWIDQGAEGEVSGLAGPVNWQRLPAGVNPIYSVAVASDGRYAAAGRANQIFLYHVPSRRALGRLTDPAVLKSKAYDKPGVAHLDLIQSLAFSPDGELLASGGYRTVKLWRRAHGAKKADLVGLESTARALAVSSDGKTAALGEDSGKIKIFDLASGKVVRTLAGHSAAVTSLSFSTDGAKLYSGSKDKSLRIWNAADGAALSKIETPTEISSLAVLTINKTVQVATGGGDKVIRLWTIPADAKTAATAKELAGSSQPVTSLAAVNATQFLSAGADGLIRHWDAASGKVIRQLNHGGPVVAVAVSGDGKKLASGSSNNSVKIWNAADGKQLFELKGDFRKALDVGKKTYEVSLSKKITAGAKSDLDAANKRKKAEEDNAKKTVEAKKKVDEALKKKVEAAKKPAADNAAAVKALAAAKDIQTKADAAKKAADAQAPKAAAALATAQAAQTAANKTAAATANAAKAADAKLKLAQEAAKKDASSKDLAAAAQAAEKAAQDAAAKNKAATDATAAAVKAVADATAKKKAADLAKTASTAALTKAQAALKASEANAKKLAAAAKKSSDEKAAAERAVTAADRSSKRAADSVKKATDAIPGITAILKQAEASQKQAEGSLQASQKTATESEKAMRALAFSADGATLAAGGDSSLVFTWDVATGAPIESYPNAAAISAVAFTTEGALLTAAANNTASVWDTTIQWNLERVIGNVDSSADLVDRILALDFSSDGKLLAVGGGEPSRSGELKLFNVENGSLVLEIKEPHSDTIFGLEFSPDGKYIASCGADRFVKVFALPSGKFHRSFEGHTHHVLGVSWRADGRVLASSGADNVIKIWDFRTGDQKRTISGFTKEITSVNYVSDGDVVVASSGDKSVRMKNSGNGGNVRNLAGASDFMFSSGVTENGKLIVAGGQDSVLRLWSDDGKSVATFAAPDAKPAGSSGG